jgi:uncharacterized protein DUF6597
MSISSTLVERAEIEFHEAADALRPFVGCFWVITAQRDAIIRVVPDGSTAISIQLQEGRDSEWCLRGPLIRPDERRFTSEATLVGIRLRPGVAFHLSGIPHTRWSVAVSRWALRLAMLGQGTRLRRFMISSLSHSAGQHPNGASTSCNGFSCNDSPVRAFIPSWPQRFTTSSVNTDACALRTWPPGAA